MAYSIKKEKGGEVGCLLGVEHVDKLGAEDGVSGSEPTSREDAQLQELGDGSVLSHLCSGGGG